MSDTPTLKVTMLGAGQEVGRSCCVLQYRGKTIVCDTGIHPAHIGMASLPFIDELDWSTVDAILITHFHLDHAAALTYIMEKTNFRDGKGKVYMTHPTKALHKFMMQDYVRMSSSGPDALFSPLDMSMSLSSIIPISAHQLIVPCPGISFTPYHAGHVLGACMFLIDIAGLRILYTGDYSREEDRHLVKAEIPPVKPDVLIIESTFGVQSHEGREEKEQRFTTLVHQIIRRGGHVLLPAFALGRAQELLLILDEYWKKHPDLHQVPIYYASSLARKCMAVYQTYIHTMNSNIRSRFAKRDNPFVFKHISNLPQQSGWERKIAEGPPCVVLASPGFMTNGPSRHLFELWAPDSRNGLIITGYSIEGTLARDVLTEPDEITSTKGVQIPRKMSVDEITFAAHVDGTQNSEFIEAIQAQHVVLVHGEATGMGRLRAKMASRYKDREEEVKIHTPRNLETLELTFRGERVAKAIGHLADAAPKANDVITGLLVAKDYSYTLLDPRDLRDFAGLSTCVVTQRQRIVLGVGWDLVRWHLEGMFGSIEEGVDDAGTPTIRVMGVVDAKHTQEHELTLEWDSSSSNDMIADSTLALLTSIDKSPASVKLTSHPHHHHDHDEHEHGHGHHPHADAADVNSLSRINRLALFLEAHFGEVELYLPEEKQPAQEKQKQRDEEIEPGGVAEDENNDDDVPSLLVRLDDMEASINLLNMTVTSEHEALRKRVEYVLEMALSTVSSLSESFTSSSASASAETAALHKKKGSHQPSPSPASAPVEDQHEDDAKMDGGVGGTTAVTTTTTASDAAQSNVDATAPVDGNDRVAVDAAVPMSEDLGELPSMEEDGNENENEDSEGDADTDADAVLQVHD